MSSNGSPLRAQMPTQGWKQFLTARTKMLAAYDIAKEQESNRQVKTRHGLVAEAEFRKWLSEFLPKRYGITSGFIVSPGISSAEHLVHYDVIITTSWNPLCYGSRIIPTHRVRESRLQYRWNMSVR